MLLKNQKISIKVKDLPKETPVEVVEQLKKIADEEEVEEIEFPFFPGMFGQTDQKSLEEQGIIQINGVISKDTLAKAQSKLWALHFDEKYTDNVQVLINSPGGYLDATWAFIDTMSAVKMHIRTVALGEIASAATMIFVAGDERVMAPNSLAMIHHFSSGNHGNYRDLVASRKMEDIEFEKMADHFLRNSKYKTREEIIEKVLLDQDNWLTPKEMKSHGLCDEVLPHKKNPKKKAIKK